MPLASRLTLARHFTVLCLSFLICQERRRSPSLAGSSWGRALGYSAAWGPHGCRELTAHLPSLLALGREGQMGAPRRAPPPAEQERGRRSRLRWVPATEGVGAPRGSAPAVCTLSPADSPQGPTACARETEGGRAARGPASREGGGRRGRGSRRRLANAGPQRAAETRRGRERQGERRPRSRAAHRQRAGLRHPLT